MSLPGRSLFMVAKAMQEEVDRSLGPPEEGLLAETHRVVPRSIVRGTRGYIEKVANQVNGCYEKGWYDGSAVMARRLVETLIIETFEHHGIADRIKNAKGEFFQLGDLIDRCVNESKWNLSRNAKQAMPKLKGLGDKSAHSRRYLAQRGDIDPLALDIRLVAQELIYLAGLK